MVALVEAPPEPSISLGIPGVLAGTDHSGDGNPSVALFPTLICLVGGAPLTACTSGTIQPWRYRTRFCGIPFDHCTCLRATDKSCGLCAFIAPVLPAGPLPQVLFHSLVSSHIGHLVASVLPNSHSPLHSIGSPMLGTQHCPSPWLTLR